MKPQARQYDAFDPTAPIGADGPVPRGPVTPDPTGDDRLTELLDQATRPPGGLKLDWSRLRENLAREELLGPPAGRKPARPQVRRLALWFSGALSAAAAIMLATVLLLLRGGAMPDLDDGPGPVPPIVATPPAQPGPTVRIGMSAEDARELIAHAADDRNEVVIVFPRQRASDVPVVTASHASPLVMTARSTSAGMRSSMPADPDSEIVLMSF